MLIRSQDKKMLCPFNLMGIYPLTKKEKDKDIVIHNIFIVVHGEEVDIAVYSTEEKAIKVLNMIQDEYLKRMELDGGYDVTNGCYVQPNFWVLPKVFQMPQDSEV